MTWEANGRAVLGILGRLGERIYAVVGWWGRGWAGGAVSGVARGARVDVLASTRRSAGVIRCR